jgi:hypothetical protein
MKIEYIITDFEKHFLPIPYSLIYAVKFLTHGQRERKRWSRSSFLTSSTKPHTGLLRAN